MNIKQLASITVLLLISLNSCQDVIFINPFGITNSIQSAQVPPYFDWSMTNEVDLKVELNIVGEEIKTFDGEIVYLLDTTFNILTQGVVHNYQTHLYHKIPAAYGRMIVYLPTTGNYDEIYSWACLGTLNLPVAWSDPDIENYLNYLEIEITPDGSESTPLIKSTMSTVFGNAEFSDDDLGRVRQYKDHKKADGKWYYTTKNGITVSIENYAGNNALKLGQGSKDKKVEVLQNIKWKETGKFTVNFDIISPSGDNIELKVFLFFYDSNWKKKNQSTKNLNIKKTKDWQSIQIDGNIGSSDVEYVSLVIQDLGNRDIFYIDNVMTNHDDDDDADDDGIPDDEDDFPEDDSKAFSNFYPSEDGFFSLAFEDLWPYQGDYDFNDLVVDCRMNQITNTNNEVVCIQGKIFVKAIGGSFHNGFGFEIPLSYRMIESVNGIDHTEEIVTLNKNGTEAGHNRAVIILFEDAYEVMINPGYAYVNTMTTHAYIDPKEINFEIILTAPVDARALGLPPYNPFMFVNGNRGREVHLFGKEPTLLADLSLLNTGDDVSDLTGGSKYYQTWSNLPFSLEVPESFDYPIEKSPVDSAYIHFVKWAESGVRTKPIGTKVMEGTVGSRRFTGSRNGVG